MQAIFKLYVTFFITFELNLVLKMNKLFFCLLFCTLINTACAQNKPYDDRFSFIEIMSEIEKPTFVKNYVVHGARSESVEKLYLEIKNKAKKDGANSFMLKNFTIDSFGQKTLSLDTYLSTDSFFKINLSNREQNIVYIISDAFFSYDKYTFKVNDVRVEIQSGEYYKITLDSTKKTKVNKRGFMGATAYFEWEKNKTSKFYTISGLSIGDNVFVNPAPGGNGIGIGVSVSTGKINLVNKFFGLLLLKIMKEHKAELGKP